MMSVIIKLSNYCLRLTNLLHEIPFADEQPFKGICQLVTGCILLKIAAQFSPFH